jgi:hypothetical protein
VLLNGLGCMRALAYETFDALFTRTESPAQKTQPREYLETRSVDDDKCIILPRSHP